MAGQRISGDRVAPESLNLLRKGFEKLLSDGRYTEKVESDVNNYLANKRRLKEDPNSIKVFLVLGKIIASRSYLRNRYASKFQERFEEYFLCDNPLPILSREGKKKFIEIMEETSFRRNDAVKNAEDLFDRLNEKSLREWTKGLYNLSLKGKTDILGGKGRDLYLRDVGYLDRIPIDIHEGRFILRTGIYHSCSRDSFDPLEKEHLQNSLKIFCRNYLNGLYVKDLELSENPTIVDKFIWYHCAGPPEALSICGKKPKCLRTDQSCPFARGCLFFQYKRI